MNNEPHLAVKGECVYAFNFGHVIVDSVSGNGDISFNVDGYWGSRKFGRYGPDNRSE